MNTTVNKEALGTIETLLSILNTTFSVLENAQMYDWESRNKIKQGFTEAIGHMIMFDGGKDYEPCRNVAVKEPYPDPPTTETIISGYGETTEMPWVSTLRHTLSARGIVLTKDASLDHMVLLACGALQK
jgi:hypothetical protein